MKVTHAHWEKRNLGVDCNEITLEKCDDEDIAKTKSIISDNIREYTVVKVPTGMIEIMFMLFITSHQI